ncbi:hypothetical protein HII31_12259 [Pseudocercospora fuligena]|uniref:SnoaL-like domain-containing protein n=1 Tax=Pseudocercospora fuligena TaxID=685502 RepID=A0A8H6VDB5_9PEZI|nr:hypothetical protein HII31_12259 [Pseudocercospora fuligena]
MSDIPEVQAELASLRTLVQSLTDRVTQLEDINAIRKLHFAYGYYIDTCSYADVVQLFAKDGEVIFLSGIYRGHASISRLYETWFHKYFTKGQPGPVHGFLLDHLQMQDIITVSADGRTAQGRFRALLAGGNHVSRAYRPEGLPLQFWEAGVYENTYVKGDDGVWRIKRLDYAVQWQAEYEKGWAHTEAHLKPFERCFPEEPLGPDELLPQARGTWPDRSDVKRHYAHPVLATAGKVKESE